MQRGKKSKACPCVLMCVFVLLTCVGSQLALLDDVKVLSCLTLCAVDVMICDSHRGVCVL